MNNKRQTSMTSTGLELTDPTNKPPLAHALDHAATEIGLSLLWEAIMPNQMVPLAEENNAPE
jgi:hypothetical protein